MIAEVLALLLLIIALNVKCKSEQESEDCVRFPGK